MPTLAILMGQVFVRKLLAFAGYSLLVYDYVITFPLELAYIWKASWTLVKAGFLVNRYGNLIGQTYVLLEEIGYLSHGSQKFCVAFWIYTTVFILFSGESIRVLVVLRAWVIWGCKHRAAVLLIAIYLFYIMFIGLTLVKGMKDVDSLYFEYLDEFGLCFAPMPAQAWTILPITMSIDSFASGFVCYNLLRLRRESRAGGLRSSPLIRVLIRDAFLFYFTSLFSGIFTIICLTTFRQDPRNFIQILITYPLISVVGQRLVLNLRGLQGRPDSTRDWSREIDRQMAAMGSPEESWDLEASGSDGNDGMVELQLLGNGDGHGASG